MTIGIVCAFKDGVVIGADRKITRFIGTEIKSLEDKIFKLQFDDGANIPVTGSGTVDLIKRAVDRINPKGLGPTVEIEYYRNYVERRVSNLRTEIEERGIKYDALLIWASVTKDKKHFSFIGRVNRSGLTEMKNNGYFTTGIAAPYAELLLKDAYKFDMSIDKAKLLVGGIIKKIGEVDNDVEGFDVLCIKGKGDIEELKEYERWGIDWSPLSLSLEEGLKELEEEVQRWKEIMKPAKEGKA